MLCARPPRLLNPNGFRLLRFNSNTAPDSPLNLPEPELGPWALERLKLSRPGAVLVPPAPPTSFAPEMEQIIRASPPTGRSIQNWNRRKLQDHLVFYHNPHSSHSVATRSLIIKTFHNHTEHVVPFRFLLEFREEILSPDAFREILYRSGEASFQQFLNPHVHPPIHVPTAEALYAAIIENPKRLSSPILLHYSLDGDANLPAISWGRHSVSNFLEQFEKLRDARVGFSNMRLIQVARRKEKEKVKKQKAERRPKNSN